MGRIILLLATVVSAHAQAVKPYLRIETGAHTARVNRIDVDAAERFLVSASDDKTARVWDLRNGKLLQILRPPIGPEQEGMLYAAAISPDATVVAVGGFTGSAGSEIYIFDRETGGIRKRIADLPEIADHLSYSSDGRYLAAGLGGKNGIRVFETARYSELARDAGYEDDCETTEFDRSGRLLTASLDGFVRLYDSSFGLLRKANPPGGKQPYSARFSPDGKSIAVTFNDTTAVSVLSGEDLSMRYSVDAPAAAENLVAASWSAGGQRVCAAGSYQVNGVRPALCWSEGGKGQPSSFPTGSSNIPDIQGLKDGGIAYSATDGSVGVLDRGGKERWRAAPDRLDFRSAVGLPQEVASSPDGDTVELAALRLDGSALTRQKIRFSVSGQRLDIDANAQPSLRHPATDGLAIAGWKNGQKPTMDGRALPLEAHETSRSLAVSPNKDTFILGTEWYVRKFDAQANPIWATPAPGAVWGVNISADGRFVVAALGDGTLRWYTFDKGDEVLAVFVHRDLRRWVAWNPDGFFSFQAGGDALIGYHINRGPDREGEFVKVDQLREVFYQPDLISQILKPGGPEAVLAARDRIGDIAKVLAGGLPPEIMLMSGADEQVTGEYQLQFRVKNTGGGVGRIVYRIDGQEIEGRGAMDVAGTGGDTINRYIPVGAGTHTLTVAAYNANGKIEGAPKTIRITRSLPAPTSNLYIIAAGISHYSDSSLSAGVRFAADDADTIADRFKDQEGKGLHRKVSTVPLRDSQATIQRIQTEIERAAKSVQQGDTFILYLAGHGVAVNGDYYFLPWEVQNTNEKDLLAKSLSRDMIRALLAKIPTSKSVLILDTCGAGAYIESPASGEAGAIGKVAVMWGGNVLAASNSKEMAAEGYQNHGVFTYVLLEGMEKAESSDNGEIFIDSLGAYLRKVVPGITDSRWKLRQTPVTRYAAGEPFPIARKVTN